MKRLMLIILTAFLPAFAQYQDCTYEELVDLRCRLCSRIKYYERQADIVRYHDKLGYRRYLSMADQTRCEVDDIETLLEQYSHTE